MEYFKIELETGKKKNLSKTIFTQQSVGITGALDVAARAKKGGRWVSINPISKEDYQRGISRKYSNNKKLK